MPETRQPEIQGTGWYEAYCDAMLENDRRAAQARIEMAQAAIQERIAQLRSITVPSSREEKDLSYALSHLAILTQRIGLESEKTLWD
jgi:succinate dehydrogenase/fumarate reductase flavoprotein subunit